MRASFASLVSPASSAGCGRTGAFGGGGRSSQITSTRFISTAASAAPACATAFSSFFSPPAVWSQGS